MIIALILQILLVLGGIILFSLFLFLVASVYDAYLPSAPEPQKKNGQAAKEKNIESAEPNADAKHAVIRCSHIPPAIPERYRTKGYTDCHIRNMVFGGNLACSSGCLGLGTCARACPNDAIIFRKGSVYISDACNGCGICIASCPKQLIEMVPVSQQNQYACAAAGITDSTVFCQTARDGYTIDSHNFPESGFKILNRWGILKSKSR